MPPTREPHIVFLKIGGLSSTVVPLPRVHSWHLSSYLGSRGSPVSVLARHQRAPLLLRSGIKSLYRLSEPIVEPGHRAILRQDVLTGSL